MYPSKFGGIVYFRPAHHFYALEHDICTRIPPPNRGSFFKSAKSGFTGKPRPTIALTILGPNCSGIEMYPSKFGGIVYFRPEHHFYALEHDICTRIPPPNRGSLFKSANSGFTGKPRPTIALTILGPNCSGIEMYPSKFGGIVYFRPEHHFYALEQDICTRIPPPYTGKPRPTIALTILGPNCSGIE